MLHKGISKIIFMTEMGGHIQDLCKKIQETRLDPDS